MSHEDAEREAWQAMLLMASLLASALLGYF